MRQYCPFGKVAVKSAGPGDRQNSVANTAAKGPRVANGMFLFGKARPANWRSREHFCNLFKA